MQQIFRSLNEYIHSPTGGGRGQEAVISARRLGLFALAMTCRALFQYHLFHFAL